MEVLEGRICILAALQAGRRTLHSLLVRQGIQDSSIRDVLDLASERGVAVKKVREEALDAHAHGRSHGGLVALADPLPPGKMPEKVDFVLFLDGVDDGRNLGYALRSAEAFGVDAVVLRRRAFDFDGGDVSRASSGAYERLPLVLADAPPQGLALVGCVAGALRTLYDVDLRRPVALAIGGEKRGLSAAVRDRCETLASIPTRPGAPSLSLTHAAAVVLAEAARQRGGVARR
jgi:23S rRNA (guanosine2251-2'-O)-methyltransferase